ncbi:MAG: molybdopterin-dependent oxidoreductase [Dehalococcoidia bacterium]|nr:molybdopterin-dependent oxidoreductase [Dehalococcoidia bacterium]
MKKPLDGSNSAAAGHSRPQRADGQDAYRDRWAWDKVAWASHCINCYPGNCQYRVYVKDGAIIREEQAGTYMPVEAGVPDMNPMGCQKGNAWSRMLQSPERVLYPLKRAGERGEGNWARVSWDEALAAVADATLDAIQESGPESVLQVATPNEGGLMAGMLFGRIIEGLGGTVTDVNADINDFNPGLYMTYGKVNSASSVDDWFHAELTLVWHRNPVYTAIPWYHFVLESRYNGGEVVTIAPDYSPSAIHADYHVPVEPGSDAALALGMCQVIIEEGLYDAGFVREQTDLPLLVRTDTRRFLRQTDVTGQGRDDQFYFLDSRTEAPAEAPRGTLALGDIVPALEGRCPVTLADGKAVEVTPVFQLLRDQLADYTPEKASAMCGTNPEMIRMLARKVATRRTNILLGFNAGKYYHGDLMERSMCLLLGLTGNWGKKGTGTRSWSVGMFDGAYLYSMKNKAGTEEALRVLNMRNMMAQAVKAQDPTMTDEMASFELMRMAAAMGNTVPPAFLWYYHCGYRERWNTAAWNDPAIGDGFDARLKEALDKGWWRGLDRPGADTPPRVLFEIGGNFLRRMRGGQKLLLENLWPKLKMVVTVDWRMHTTGMYSDIFLPVALSYEKLTFHIPTPDILNLTFSDKAAPPPGEAKPEWEIFRLLAEKIEERAAARGFVEYRDARGGAHRLDNLAAAYTLGGAIDSPEKLADEWIRDTAAFGNLPEGADLETMREKGSLRFTNWGAVPFAIAQASDLEPDSTHNPFRWHTEKKLPYPTLTRRAQFYIDHEWFLEAAEQLPVHKENPRQGGDHPFTLTSGHSRWTIHSTNVVNRMMLQTHRGEPSVLLNPGDAAGRGIEADHRVRVFNDVSSFVCAAKLSPAVKPGQVIMYNGWEPYQFEQWEDPSSAEPGMVKWLHLAGGYGHLRYWLMQCQPVPIDRGIAVDIARA